MGQRTKGAVGRGVRIATDDRHAGQGGAVLRPNDVDDALALGEKGEESGSAKLFNIGVQRNDLLFAGRVGDAVVTAFPAGGGGVVVGRGDDRADAPDFATRFAQAFKSLGAGHFMHQVAVDVEDGRAVVLGVDDVVVPQFVVKRACNSRHRGLLSEMQF